MRPDRDNVTAHVLAEGRLRVLDQIGTATAAAVTPEEVCTACIGVLAAAPDTSAAAVYLRDPASGAVRLVCAAPPGAAPALPGAVAVTDADPWKVREAIARREALDVRWRDGEPPAMAIVLPLERPAGSRVPYGALVVALHAGCSLDAEGQRFHRLAARLLASALAAVGASDEDRQRLLASERKFATAFNRSPLPLTITSLEDARLVEVNEAFVRVAGYSREEAIGRTPEDLRLWVEPQARADRFEKLRLGTPIPDVQARFRLKNGEERVGIIGSVVVEIDGRRCVLSSVLDVTDRIRAEDARRRWEHVFVHAGWAVAVAHPETDILEMVNPAFAAMHGYPVDEMIGRRLADVVAPESRDSIARHAERAHERGDETYESLHVRKDGTRFPVLAHVTAIRDQAGEVIYRAATFQELTELKRAEEALQQSEERFRLATSAGKVGIWDWDIAANRVTWSETLYRIHGLEPHAFDGTVEAFAALVHPDDQARVGAALQRSLAEQLPYELEFRAVRPDGRVVWIYTHATVLRSDTGSPARMLGATVDVTARKDAEQELRSSEERFRRVIEAAPSGIVLVSPEGRIEMINPEAEHVFGYGPGELLGERIEVLIPERLQHGHDASRQGFLRDPVARPMGAGRDLFARRKDGSEFPVEIGLAPLATADGTLVLATVVDITGRRRAQEALTAARDAAEAANRLKDEFLATVSHELRTPLNAVLGWAHLLRSGSLRPDVVQRGFESLERNARAQMQLVDDLLDMSRIVSGKLQIGHDPVDLAAVVHAAVETVRPAALARRLVLETGPDPPDPIRVDGDADRLRQVVWNLLSNAVKFTPAGGRVEVALAASDGHARVVVRDTGEGIDRAFLPFVFDRFRQADGATTRRHGGLGLGLAIVRHLTEAHGGSVVAESDGPGCGATFTVRLPLGVSDRGRPARTPRARRGSAGRLQGARVLVVDDDADAREVLRAVLQSEKAHVTTAASATEALELLQLGTHDVLLADIGMPGRDGYWLIRAVRGLAGPSQGIPAIAVTAYASLRERETALHAGFDAHLAKPVEPDHLIGSVAAAMARRDRRPSRPGAVRPDARVEPPEDASLS